MSEWLGRKQPQPDRLSTCEALGALLRELGGNITLRYRGQCTSVSRVRFASFYESYVSSA